MQRRFSLNQVTVPTKGWREFLAISKAAGCAGVEFRNDLGRPIFEGADPKMVGQVVRESGLEIFGVSQIYPFNVWNSARLDELTALLDIAKDCGAGTVNLIPLNGHPSNNEPLTDLKPLLSDVSQIAKEARVRILVEPLGFQRASIRFKKTVAAAITNIGASDVIGLVHDTFHHHLSGETRYYAELTGMVHVSGVSNPEQGREYSDEDRGLVNVHDLLGNLVQIRALIDAGYQGPISMESFSPQVQALDEPTTFLRESFEFIQESLSH